MFLEENFGEPGTNHMLHHDVCGSRVSQIAPHPTLSPHRPTAQARWDLAGRGSETLWAVIEVMHAQLVHSLSPFLRGEGGVRGLESCGCRSLPRGYQRMLMFLICV
jgi:hypothetical protein